VAVVSTLLNPSLFFVSSLISFPHRQLDNLSPQVQRVARHLEASGAADKERLGGHAGGTGFAAGFTLGLPQAKPAASSSSGSSSSSSSSSGGAEAVVGVAHVASAVEVRGPAFAAARRCCKFRC
jgi:hypothetical protein